MKLIPRIKEADIEPGSIKIWADKASLEQAKKTVAEASKVTQIVKSDDLGIIVPKAQALHKVLAEIEKSRQSAKRQFLDANKAIDDLAKQIAGPVKEQYDRLTKLMAAWHDAEQRRKEEAERERLKEMEKAQAEERAKEAERERQRQALVAAQASAKTRQELEQVNMDLEFLETDIPVEVGNQLEAVEIPLAPKAPIEGARTSKRYKFTLTDPVAALQYDKTLVRTELNILVAQDIVRLLKERSLEIKIPGVTIEEYTDVSTPSGR
jgi:DNA repair exonuclease SbcCD ATPase subunit